MPIGSAMFFVLSLVASVIIGLFVVNYAARTFMNILNGTAAGNDDVPWPSDPFLDRLGDPFFLFFLVALPSVPALGITGMISPELLDRPEGLGLTLFMVVWLVFPIMLLSALTGSSRWLVLHWEFLRRLVRRPGTLLLFYVSSAAVLGLGGLSVRFAVFFPNALAPAAVLVTSACVLIYARLCGRFAWVVGQTPIRAKRPKRVRGVVASDPWQVAAEPEEETPPTREPETSFIALDSRPETEPDEEEDEWTPNKKPYTFSADVPPPSVPAAAPRSEAITCSPLPMMAESQVNETAPEPHNLPGDPVPKPDRVELRWMEGRKKPVLPRWPLVKGVWEFPFCANMLGRFASLSALCVALVMMIRFMLMLAGGAIHGALR